MDRTSLRLLGIASDAFVASTKPFGSFTFWKLFGKVNSARDAVFAAVRFKPIPTAVRIAAFVVLHGFDNDLFHGYILAKSRIAATITNTTTRTQKTCTSQSGIVIPNLRKPIVATATMPAMMTIAMA